MQRLCALSVTIESGYTTILTTGRLRPINQNKLFVIKEIEFKEINHVGVHIL